MTLIELAQKLRTKSVEQAQAMEDIDALDYAEQFANWKANTSYEVGYKLRYSGIQYKVLQAHTSQAGWEPDKAASQFAKVLIPDPQVIPEWEQPDSTNPYMAGDKVTHNGKTWESKIDNNVWEPGAVGTELLWQEVTES